jgi:hypothetical protein
MQKKSEKYKERNRKGRRNKLRKPEEHVKLRTSVK